MGTSSRVLRCLSAAAFLVCGVAGAVDRASAHVVFGNPLYSDPSVIDPLTGSLGVGAQFSNQNSTALSNAGWAIALDPATGGDSHNARLRYFNLAQPQTIEFTITAAANANGASLLNPGYSLYNGTVPLNAHDAGTYPGQMPFATWSPFADSPGSVGSDPSSQKWGEFQSHADVTMRADDAVGNPIVSTMTYTGLSDSTETGNSISGIYHLGPGLYTLAIGGANPADAAALLAAAQATNGDYSTPSQALTDYQNLRAGRNFAIQFAVSPVPIPAAAWLFAGGLAGVAALARRRKP